MAERSLRAELAEVVGSANEATWILEQITDPVSYTHLTLPTIYSV